MTVAKASEEGLLRSFLRLTGEGLAKGRFSLSKQFSILAEMVMSNSTELLLLLDILLLRSFASSFVLSND